MTKRNQVNQAVILVGGRGTRLGALTNQTPKPMLMVGEKPFLEYLLQRLKQQTIRKILLCVGYLAESFQQYFGDGQRLGLQIEYNLETEPAGTGGPLVLARDRLDEQFFVFNGDTIFDIPLQALSEKLRLQPEALGIIALRTVPDISRYSGVQLGGDWILRFHEKGGAGAGLINGGIYCLRKTAVDLLSAPPCSIEKNLFPLLAGRRELLGESFAGYFIDIGLPETLQQAEVELPGWLASKKPAGNLS
jgi:NDP-sugar pyrophosphorylase family protein